MIHGFGMKMRIGLNGGGRLSLLNRFLCHKTTLSVVMVGTTWSESRQHLGKLQTHSPVASSSALRSTYPARSTLTTRRMRNTFVRQNCFEVQGK